MGVLGVTAILGAIMVAHVFLGWLIASRAVGRLRKRVF